MAQRFVRGLGGASISVTGCHFLPLVDAQGNHQVICAYEVEEITTVAETRLPPWAREVFSSVRARDQSLNMRLMISAFGHRFMIMGGLGYGFLPQG